MYHTNARGKYLLIGENKGVYGVVYGDSLYSAQFFCNSKTVPKNPKLKFIKIIIPSKIAPRN